MCIWDIWEYEYEYKGTSETRYVHIKYHVLITPL
jgi:hypothetical protein